MNAIILERLGYIPLPEKENELLYKNFKYKDINELQADLENVATKQDCDKLSNNINNRGIFFKELIKTVADN